MKKITIEISEAMAYNVSVAMKNDKQYAKGTPFDKLQKDLEFCGKRSEFIKEIRNE